MNKTACDAAKIIDELLCLFVLRDGKAALDYNIVDDALRFVARVKKEVPKQPITVALDDLLRKRGLLGVERTFVKEFL